MGTLDELLNSDAARQQQAAQDAQDAEDAQAGYAVAGSDANDPRYQDVLPGGGTGTSEASRAAMETADKMRGEVDTGYASIQAAQQKQANAVRDAIRAARQRLIDRKPSNDVYWFNIAKALGQPTQTGTFGEGLGNFSGAMASGREMLHKEEDAKENDMGKYDTTLAQYGNDPDAISPDLLNTKLGLLKLKLQQAGALDVAATRNAGRTGAVNTSAIAKLAAEESDPNLSPAQRQAAHEMKLKMLRPPRDPNAQVPMTEADNKVADSVANYDMNPTLALSRIGTEKRESFLQRVLTTNPNYQDSNYITVNQKRHDINATGPTSAGGRLISFGALLPHMELILNLSKALQGGNVKAINSAKNAMATYFGGSSKAVNLQSAVQLWAPEIERAIALGQGSKQKAGFRALITNASKPDVVSDQISKVFFPMVSSKMDNILSDFYGSMPPEQKEKLLAQGYVERKLSKESRRILMRRGLLQDYNWDLGDLGDVGGTRGTVTRGAPGGPPKILPTGAGAPAAAPTAKSKALSPDAQSFLSQVGG